MPLQTFTLPNSLRTPLSKLIAPETFNTTANAALLIATPILAVSELRASAMEVGVLATDGTSAPLLFGLSAGAIADRFDQASLLLWCGVMRLFMAALIPIQLMLDRTKSDAPPWLYLIWFVCIGIAIDSRSTLGQWRVVRGA